MKIGLDFDDVIAWTHGLKPRAAQELFGVEIDSDSFRREWVVSAGVLNDEQYTRAVRRVYEGAYPISAVPDALTCIVRLIGDGHSLQVVTNRSEEHKNLEYARSWLREYLIDIPVTGVVYGNSKAAACAGLDVYVDDDPKKLEELVGIVPHLIRLCWPHTEHIPSKEGVIDLRSWHEIYDYVTNHCV